MKRLFEEKTTLKYNIDFNDFQEEYGDMFF